MTDNRLVFRTFMRAFVRNPPFRLGRYPLPSRSSLGFRAVLEQDGKPDRPVVSAILAQLTGYATVLAQPSPRPGASYGFPSPSHHAGPILIVVLFKC